ncbi:MAG: methyltransferase domain-containing protein [Anaerolineae bacterium]|nr:methyltransferase domain-containing protein [Anaerolineae bacterium]
MTLTEFIHRTPIPAPWSEGEKIPWDDPDFSRRMLREHLSQAHDAASRRTEVIEQHIVRIHQHLLGEKPTRILDLGCGPGLYSSRLARLGHTCVGIDFSPASITYARQTAEVEQLTCTYHQADLRAADFGDNFGLAMFIFGELNVFRPADARRILQKMNAALVPNGILLLEPQSADAVQKNGQIAPSWSTNESGLFSDDPHLVLTETFWDADQHVTTERFAVVDAATAHVTRYAFSTQAYTDDEFCTLLTECGFTDIQIWPALTGQGARQDFFAITARKSPS